MKKYIVFSILSLIIFITTVQAQSQLDSNSYTILDASINSGGEISDSDYYSIVTNTGNYISDYRFTSDTYTIQNAFPNGIIANVPQINCFETSSTNLNTTCSATELTNGMQGVCGAPGCYDRAKVEVDTQDNPIDTLYLIKIVDTDSNNTYYLNNSHTLSSSLDINSFMDKCNLEGYDPLNIDCDDSGDVLWDADLQKYNILGLKPNTNYSVSVSALSGDFTGTDFSPIDTSATQDLSIVFDLDVAEVDQDSDGPYGIGFGTIPFTNITTAQSKIWIDVSSNAIDGTRVYIRDAFDGLYSSSTLETIPSETEDLAVDPNNNGGYGIKMSSITQTSLGPLIVNSTYDTGTQDSVGGVSTSNTLLLYSENLSTNMGVLNGGRASFQLKIKPYVGTKSSAFEDILTFTCLNDF